jgi:oligosaccharide repeat unit polymerase
VDTGLSFTVDLAAILWWIFLALVWCLHRRLVGYKGITTFTLFLPLTFVTNGLLVPLIRDLNYQITGVDITSYSDYWWALALMYVAILLGIVLANLLRHGEAANSPALDQCDIVGNPAAARWYVGIVLLISVVSLIQIYGRGLSFDVYSYLTMKMDYGTYAAHRYGFADATRGWEFFVYNKLPYGIAPLAIILVWNARGLATWKRVAFILLLALALLQTGHKMPVVFLLVYMAVSRALIRSRLALDRKTVLACVALFLIVIVGIVPAFYLMQGDETYGSSLFWSVERLSLEEARALQLYFEVYPNIHPFLHGASNATIAKLMGGTNYIPPAAYIPNEVLGLQDTSFPTLFIGEGWADFGFLGVFLTSVFVGFLLQIYNIWFYNRKRLRLEETALFLSIVFATYHLHASNLLTSFFSYGMVGNFFIYLLIRRRRTSLSESAISTNPRDLLSGPSTLAPGQA